MLVLGIDLPNTWSAMADSDTYRRETLNHTDAEYQKVRKTFTTSMTAGGRSCNVVQVCDKT